MTLEKLKTKLVEGYDIGQKPSLALIAIIEDVEDWIEARKLCGEIMLPDLEAIKTRRLEGEE